MTVVREEVRDYGWESVVGSLLADVRHAARRLRQKPASRRQRRHARAWASAPTTAIFSVINGVLLKPLPYPKPERWSRCAHGARRQIAELNMAPSLYFTYRDESRTFRTSGCGIDVTSVVTGPASRRRSGRCW